MRYLKKKSRHNSIQSSEHLGNRKVEKILASYRAKTFHGIRCRYRMKKFQNSSIAFTHCLEELQDCTQNIIPKH